MKIRSWWLDNWYVDCGWTLIRCHVSCGCYLVVVIGPLVCYLWLFLISDMCCRATRLYVPVGCSCHESTDQPLPWSGLHGQGLSCLIRFGLAYRCFTSLASSYLRTSLRIVPVCLIVCVFPSPDLEGGLIFVIMISKCGMCFIVSTDMVVGIPWWTYHMYGLITLSADVPRCSITFYYYQLLY